MKNMTLLRAENASGGRLCGAYDVKTELRRVVIDSRLVQPGDLFVAYQGEKVDGHDYIAAAFAKGAVCCVRSSVSGKTVPPQVNSLSSGSVIRTRYSPVRTKSIA